MPESVNFPLLPGKKQQDYKVLLFGDPQPYDHQQVEYFNRDIIGEHTVTIRVKDMFGRTFTETYRYRVVKPR